MRSYPHCDWPVVDPSPAIFFQMQHSPDLNLVWHYIPRHNSYGQILQCLLIVVARCSKQRSVHYCQSRGEMPIPIVHVHPGRLLAEQLYRWYPGTVWRDEYLISWCISGHFDQRWTVVRCCHWTPTLQWETPTRQ